MTDHYKHEYDANGKHLNQTTPRRLSADQPKQIFPGQAVLGALPSKGHVPILHPTTIGMATEYMDISKLTLEKRAEDQPAHGFLEEACNVMKHKAQLRDKPEGERSMEAIVNTFNVLTGKNLTEGEGWEFMILLKMVRGRQGKYNRDDYVDLAGYSGLLGECESVRKNNG